MAGIRLGMAFAGKEIIEVLNQIKYPYNINILTQRTALEYLSDTGKKDQWIKEILEQREYLRKELSQLPMVKHILAQRCQFSDGEI